MLSEYDVYKAFKEVEGEVKGKTVSILGEDGYTKRVSGGTRDALRQAAGLFSTKFSNIDLKEYIRCGFFHFKGFNYDKLFRDIVINEYIARDSRKKRDIQEPITKVMADLKYIGKPVELYLKEQEGNTKRIIRDYLMNKIGSTIVVYCIWRNLFQPTTIEWEYLNIIQNNYPAFEKNVVKFATMIDKWRATIKKDEKER
jgi:hypothetical protein